MAKVKKYDWGTFSVSGASPQMINPGNAALKQYTTTSSNSIPTGSLPTSGDISQVAYTKDAVKGPSFKDKAGAFMGNYGGAITKAAGSLMPLLMKKPDPNAKPYKKGSKLIKYQAGTNNAVTDDPEDLHAYFGRVLGQKRTKPQATNDDLIGPAGKTNAFEGEMSEQDRKSFNDYLDKKEAIDRVNAMGVPVSPIAPKMASFKTAELPSMPSRLNTIPVEKRSRRERKQQDRMNTRLANTPITYTDQNKIREEAESARNTYETRLAGEESRNAYEAKQKGTPITDALLKSTMSSQAFKETMTPKAPITYKENKGGYSRALKSGKRNAQGNLVDPDTGLEYKDIRKKSSNPVAGKELVRMNRGLNNFYTPGGLPIPIKRNYIDNRSYGFNLERAKPVHIAEKFQEGTKSVSKKPTKQDYLDAAAKMTPAQRKQFHELDAKGVKFKFGDLEYSGLQKGKGGSKGGNAPANTGNGAAQTPPQTPPQNIRKNTSAPQNEGGGQYSNVDWSGKSGFEWRNPLSSIVRPLTRIGAGASSKGLAGVGAGLVGEIANIVADYTPKGIVNSTANNVQTAADAYNAYRAMAHSGINLKNLNPKEGLKKLKDFWKNKIQMTGNPLPQMTGGGRTSPTGVQLNLPF